MFHFGIHGYSSKRNKKTIAWQKKQYKISLINAEISYQDKMLFHVKHQEDLWEKHSLSLIRKAE